MSFDLTSDGPLENTKPINADYFKPLSTIQRLTAS
jgi:hypothetical protein